MRNLLLTKSKAVRFAAGFSAASIIFLFVHWALSGRPTVDTIPQMIVVASIVGLMVAFQEVLSKR